MFGPARGVARAAFLLAVLLVGCASGPPLLMGQPIKKELAVVVRVSKEAVHGDKFGGIAAMADVVTEGLTKRGVANQLYAADDDHPRAPRIEIWVMRWSETNSDLKEAGGIVGGLIGAGLQAGASGEYEVDVKIYREGDAQPACIRKHTGVVDTDDAASDESAGESIGGRILSDALRATSDCPSDTNSYRFGNPP